MLETEEASLETLIKDFNSFAWRVTREGDVLCEKLNAIVNETKTEKSEEKLKILKNVTNSIEHKTHAKMNERSRPLLKAIWAISAINQNASLISDMKDQLFDMTYEASNNRNIPQYHLKCLLGILINVSRTQKGKQSISTMMPEISKIIETSSMYDTLKEESSLLASKLKDLDTSKV